MRYLYFNYGEKEIDYLKAKDKKLEAVIDRIGHINRKVDDDLFSSVIYHILGQQISTAAQETLWNRLADKVGDVNADSISSLNRDELQSIGITYKKADYIMDFTQKVREGSFYGTVASLYLWAIAGGAIPELTDPAPAKKK